MCSERRGGTDGVGSDLEAKLSLILSSLKRRGMGSCKFLGNSQAYRFKCGPDCPLNSIKFAHVPVLRVSFPCSLSAITASTAACLSMETPPEGYRRNVGICLLSPSKKVFAAERINIPGTWQMPQGGADEGEDLRSAAMRELREETAVTSTEFLAEAPYWLTYDFPIGVRDRLNRRWGTNYKGQAQKWFLFRFTGKEDEINLLGDGSEKPEFNNWSWMLPERVVDLAVDFKKPVYEQVMKLFSPYLQAEVNEGNLSEENESNATIYMGSTSA